MKDKSDISEVLELQIYRMVMDLTKEYLKGLEDLQNIQGTVVSNLRKTLVMNEKIIERKTERKFYLEPIALQANFLSTEVYNCHRKRVLDLANEKLRDFAKDLKNYNILPGKRVDNETNS